MRGGVLPPVPRGMLPQCHVRAHTHRHARLHAEVEEEKKFYDDDEKEGSYTRCRVVGAVLWLWRMRGCAAVVVRGDGCKGHSLGEAERGEGGARQSVINS